tara:strand:- start:1799 stop:3547 length:1749 start_codon:yes stop_codon:yes gene_type:complete
MKNKNIKLSLIKKMIFLMSYKQKIYLIPLFLLMILSSLLELISIGMILPILNILTNNNNQSEIFKFIEKFILPVNYNNDEVIIYLFIFFIIFYLLKTLAISLIIWFQATYSEGISKYLSEKLYKKYLSQNYIFFITRNSSELIRNIRDDISSYCSHGIISILQLFTEIFLIIAMMIFLLYYNTSATIIIFIIFTILAVFFNFLFSSLSINLGKKQLITNKLLLQYLSQGLQNFKEIQILGRQKEFIKSFAIQLNNKFEINRKTFFIQKIPKNWIEFFLIIIISIIAIFLIKNDVDFISLLSGLIIYGAIGIKTAPSVARIISLIQKIQFGLPLINNIYNEFKLKIVVNENIENIKFTFQNKISIKNLSFNYSNKKENVINNLNFDIPKNSKIGIVGPSGSGKSTLMDILTGVIKPTTGNILIDGIPLGDESLRSWQNQIGYVPQKVVLIDDTIKNNIALGIEEKIINNSNIKKSIIMSNLEDFVSNLPQKDNTIVGEQGSFLSGGQIQRIGIARALYSDPSVLFLDEATSSLDFATEKSIIDSIIKLKNKTIIIISHRLNSLKSCDILISLDQGKYIINKNN